MNELQSVIASNWEKLQGVVRANAARLYWRELLHQGERIPTRETLAIVLEGIEAIKAKHEIWPERQSFPFYELALLAEAWLKLERLRIRRLIEAEGEM